MTDEASENIKSLRDDVRSLRADIAETVRTTAHRGWRSAKGGAQTVVDEIEEHALIASLFALFVGIALGLLIGTRR